MELLLFSALGQQPSNGESEQATKANEQLKNLNEKIAYTSSILNNRSPSPMQREANKDRDARDPQRDQRESPRESVRENVRENVRRDNLRECLRGVEGARESARESALRESRGNAREMAGGRELNNLGNLSKQATLAALVASMNQFSNQLPPGQQLASNPASGNQLNHFANSNLSGALSGNLPNQLSNSGPHANSLHPSGQFINNHLLSNQFSTGNHSASQHSGGQLPDGHLLSSQQLHNSLTFDNVQNLLLSNQRKADLQENSIFSGGFQNLLTSLNLSIGSTNNETAGFQQNASSNTIASPNWRPIRSNAQNIITSAKQSGPASWIDRSKLGKVAAQSMYSL